MIGMRGADGQPLMRIDREHLVNQLKRTVEVNPTVLGAYLGWEPNALGEGDLTRRLHSDRAGEVAGGAGASSQASAELTKLAEQQRRLINQFRV